MSRAPGWLWSSFSGLTQPSTDTPVRITSIGCADGGNCSSAVLTAAGRPRSDFSLALYAASSATVRSEEHTSELQSLMRNSYAVFCLKKKTHRNDRTNEITLQQQQ